jgi:fermentation-respiration switch protein FrsA (DUF1100 family)
MRILSIVKWLIALLVAAYIGVHAYMFFKQRDLQYEVAGEQVALAEADIPGAQEVKIDTGNDKQIYAWYTPSSQNKPTIIYYRGNSGSFTREHKRFAQFVADGYGFLSLDYRGFPGTPGALNQENILEDALNVYDWVAARDDQILLWGRSLGSGVATYVASEREAIALALESPFTATVDVAKERYPYLLVDVVMQDKFPSREWMKDVNEPVFVAHGTADKVISVHFGERLYEMVPNKDGIWIVEGGTHGSLWDDGIWAEVKAFYERHTR